MLAVSDITVLIPAAGAVPTEPLQSTGVGCPAMIPVGGRPVAYWSLRYLRELGFRKFVFAVAERGLFVEEYVDYVIDSECDVRFVKPSVDGGLGRTVYELAEVAETKAVLIVLGDTLFSFENVSLLDSENPVMLVHPVDEPFRWCTVEVDENNYVTALHDKEPTQAISQSALIGVYFIPDCEQLRAAARQAIDESRGITQLSTILKHLNRRVPLRVAAAGSWQDCGNPDRYEGSRRKLLESRAFNHLHVEPLFGIIRKSSERGEKLIDEINYLRLLPAELAVLFPRLVDYSIETDSPWMRMEYFGFPTLAEVFLYEGLSNGAWMRIFNRLGDLIQKCFMRWPRKLDSATLRSMYLDKTRQRLESLTGPPELIELVHSDKSVAVNGEELANIPLLWPIIEKQVDRMCGGRHGSIIHGDLCFSNILYDWRSDACKLIDPRGSFGSAGIYGDPRYDVAKLYHSVYGLYDFIVHDLFRVKMEGRNVSFKIGASSHQADVRTLFERVFFTQFDRKEILLITGLLFVSMPPLHYDHPERQIAMYVRGLQLLNEACSTIGKFA